MRAYYDILIVFDLIWVLTKCSTIFQLYHGGQRETTDSDEIHLQTKNSHNSH